MDQNLANAQAVRFLSELGLSEYKLNEDYVVIPDGMGYTYLGFEKTKNPTYAEHHFSPSLQRGATYNSGCGVISPGNGKFDIYTCNPKMVDRAYDAMDRELPYKRLPTLGVKFYQGTRDVWFDSPKLNQDFEAMRERHYRQTMVEARGYEDPERIKANREKAQKFLEELGIKGAKEGENYIILQNGEKYRAYNDWQKIIGDTQIELDLSRLEYKKDGYSRSAYNGGAMTIYDGKSDFIILTTDPDIMDQIKTEKRGGWVPCYNAGKGAIFSDGYLEEQFSHMIEVSNKKKDARSATRHYENGGR